MNQNEGEQDCCLYYIGDKAPSGKLNIKRNPSFYDAIQLLNPTTTPKQLPDKFHQLPLRASTSITFHFEKNKQIHFLFHLSNETIFIKEESDTCQSAFRFLSCLMIKRKNAIMFMAHMPTQPVNQTKKLQPPKLPAYI